MTKELVIEEEVEDVPSGAGMGPQIVEDPVERKEDEAKQDEPAQDESSAKPETPKEETPVEPETPKQDEEPVEAAGDEAKGDGTQRLANFITNRIKHKIQNG